MDNRIKTAGVTALIWGGLALPSFALLLLRDVGGDVYDVERGLRLLDTRPALLIATHLAFAWSGAALVFMVMAFHGWLRAEADSYLGRVATAFGLVAAAFFLFLGLIGAFGHFDLAYVASTRSLGYVSEAFLPLTIITNRVLAAGVTVLGFWFALTNGIALRRGALPQTTSVVGLGIGALVLLGLALPGGGFSFLGLLMGPVWAIGAGLSLLRRQPRAAVPSRGS